MAMNWDQYGMLVALATALKSKDTNTQVGAIIMAPDHTIVSTGYNGPPKGIDDTLLPQTRPEKYLYIVHAELNAILNAKRDLTGHTMYCTLHPCMECFKLAVHTNLEHIIYLKDFDQRAKWKEDKKAIMTLYNLCNIVIGKFEDYNDAIYALLKQIRGVYYAMDK